MQGSRGEEWDGSDNGGREPAGQPLSEKCWRARGYIPWWVQGFCPQQGAWPPGTVCCPHGPSAVGPWNEGQGCVANLMAGQAAIRSSQMEEDSLPPHPASGDPRLGGRRRDTGEAKDARQDDGATGLGNVPVEKIGPYLFPGTL